MASNCRKFVEEIFDWIEENAPWLEEWLLPFYDKQKLIDDWVEQCKRTKDKKSFLDDFMDTLWNEATSAEFFNCKTDKDWNEACEFLKELRNKHKLEDYRDCEWVEHLNPITPCDIVTGIILCAIDEELDALFETFSKRLQRF
jgi:hypothetical protein